MNLTVSTISKSLADYLAPSFPDVTFYEDPNQQGSKPPMMFLQTRTNRLTLETGGYWRRIMGLDLVYLLEYNLPNLQQLYQAAGEQLDLLMETFPYSDGTTEGTVLLRTYDREWNIDLDELHYRFEIRERVSIPQEYAKMMTMDYDEDIKDERQEIQARGAAERPSLCQAPEGLPWGGPLERRIHLGRGREGGQGIFQRQGA